MGLGVRATKVSIWFRKTITPIIFACAMSIGMLTINTGTVSAMPWCRASFGYRGVYGGCEIERRWTQIRLIVQCEADGLDWVFSRYSYWSSWYYFQSMQTSVSCGTTARPTSYTFQYRYR